MNQTSFDWTAPAAEPQPEPPVIAPWATQGAKLDADGHLWWARFCRGKHEDLIGMALKSPEFGKDYSALAGSWKRQAAMHEARGQAMKQSA